MKRIGLTGGMGSGKSTVAALFESFGCLVLDADHVARSVRKPGGLAHAAILEKFQTDDRALLRKIISESPEAKKDLEGILHPLIQQESDALMKQMKRDKPNAPCLLYEATLLIEAGRAPDFDFVIVVTAPLSDRVARVAARDKISPEDASALIKTQNSDEYRASHAHFVIKNEGQRSDLEVEVRKVLDQIISTC